jgi:D-alanyl-D-alanine carboxypeptidase
VSSVQVDGKSIVGVVLGGASTPARDNQMRKLIAAYLPKASSRGGASDLIAQTAPQPAAPVAETRVASAAPEVNLPRTARAPDTRSQPASAQVAYADVTKSKSDNPLLQQEMPAPTKVKTQPIKQASVATPTPAPTYVPPEQGDTSVDELTTASTKEPQLTGWAVQIGVSTSKEGAMDLLDSAKIKGGKALRSAKPIAVANAGGYRARFGGFDDQRAAVNACNALKRAGVKCWATAQ